MATDGLTFFFSAWLMARIRKEERTPAPSERKSVVAEIRDGLRIVFGDRRLWSIAGCTGTANFFSGALFALFSIYAIRSLGLNAFWVGVIGGVGGIGGIPGAFTPDRLSQRIGGGHADNH